MHGPIRERLEDLLQGGTPPAEIENHLASCGECSSAVSQMEETSQWVRTLRPAEEIEPSAGFYARVLQRIEEQGVRSIWSVFTEGAFGTRLAYGALGLALLIGTWLVTTERHDGHIGSEPVIAHVTPSGKDVQVTGNQAHQRDVVLVNLAAYSDDSQ